jgi:acyl carrier protein
VTREQLVQVLREWQGLRDADADADADAEADAGVDPELEAVRLAILLEDVLGAVLRDDDIDLAVLSDPDAVLKLVARGIVR